MFWKLSSFNTFKKLEKKLEVKEGHLVILNVVCMLAYIKHFIVLDFVKNFNSSKYISHIEKSVVMSYFMSRINLRHHFNMCY